MNQSKKFIDDDGFLVSSTEHDVSNIHEENQTAVEVETSESSLMLCDEMVLDSEMKIMQTSDKILVDKESCKGHREGEIYTSQKLHALYNNL